MTIRAAWLGIIAALTIVGAALAADEKPQYYLRFPCPTGETVQANTTDPEIVILYIMGITGKITPDDFSKIMLGKFPDRSRDIAEFARKCLGANGSA